MSTKMTWQINTDSLEETVDLGQKLGKQLKGGEVIELISDLGGGKTTFTRGLASGAGSTDHVSSPTFTISKRYKGKQLIIEHFDFYRLNDAGLMKNEISDFIGLKDAVIVVEWPDIVEDILPESKITVLIKSTGESSRNISIQIPEELGYIKL